MELDKKRVSFSHIEIELPPGVINHAYQNGDTTSSSQDSQDSRRSSNTSLNNHYHSVNSQNLTLKRGRDEAQLLRITMSDPIKFMETRRRSHAFSVSAIDESLSVNNTDEETSSSDAKEGDGEQSNKIPKHIKKKLKKMEQTYNPKYRHAEIPVTNDFHMLISRTKNEIIAPKSFRNEVRAIRDIETFLEHPYILLNVEATNVEGIMEEMFQLFEVALKKDAINEMRNSLYTQESGFQFANFIQGIYHTDNGQFLHDPTWICTFASLKSLQSRRVVVARLQKPTNFGPTLRAVQFVILVLVPFKEKSSKNSFEIARTFSTLFADSSLRIALCTATNISQFISILTERLENLKSSSSIEKIKYQQGFGVSKVPYELAPAKANKFKFTFGRGLKENFCRRIKYYPSDFVDGVFGPKTLSKVCSATLSLFFACILPCVAFGVLNEHNTDGLIGPKEALLGQAIGGLLFALLAGQPLVIIATTAPLCLYTSVIFRIAQNLEVDFFDLFAAVGLWNALFVILYALFDLSQLMHFCTRSTEEIFSTFIFFAFAIDAIKECVSSFENHYCFERNVNSTGLLPKMTECAPDKSILFLFLMLGTVALAVLLYNFSWTPYLNGKIREALGDYALPLSVIIFSIIGSAAFQDVKPDTFEVPEDFRWRFATLTSLNIAAVFLSLLLGFALSMLFFIDQNVSAALVSAPANRLKKGDAYHWDLLVVGLLNAALSLVGLPWMHGILPHSPMHARALADVAIATHSQDASRATIVVRVRETRLTGILIHVLIALVVIFIPQTVALIPVSVLCGLFLYCAVSTLRENSLYERILLLFTEQSSYPPTHYLRHCPQRIVHFFTGSQVIQLIAICFFGFAPWEYVQLIFPLIIALLIPIRWLVMPRFLQESYLSIIDNKHN